MNYLKKSKVFYILVIAISTLFLWSKIKEIDILSRLFSIVIDTLLIPIILSLFIYYLLKPVYLFLLKKMNETISLILTLLIFFFGIFLLVKEFIPLLLYQIDTLVNSLPRMIEELDNWLIESQIFNGNDIHHYLSLVNSSFEDLISILFLGVRQSTMHLLDFATSSFLVISIVPLLVIFMLKNTKKSENMFHIFPEAYRLPIESYFQEVESILSDYIGGKAIVCFYVFLGAWLTFTIAGLKGALLFAVIAGIMDIVPYFGPWIGTFPAILSGLITNDVNIIILVTGILIVQLGESYIVSPYILSKELKMHTLTVVITMLITGQAFGLIGMIIVLPIIAVGKSTVKHLVKFFKVRNN